MPKGEESTATIKPGPFDVWPIAAKRLGDDLAVFNWCETHKRPEWVCKETGAHR